MHCCPRSPFLSPLWAEMPYHRFGNSVVQHRAHPVETLRRMARRHSRPSPRPYMRTGRSGVRPDGVFHLGRHRHSRHAVKARRIVRTEVRAAVTQLFFMMTYGVVEVYVAIYAVLHRLLSGGIYFIGIAVATVATRILLGRVVDKYGEAQLVYTENAAIITGILLLVFAHNISCYLLLAALLGYSFGAVQPALQTMVMPAERRGAASSTFFVAFDFGIALGGFFAGLLVKYREYDDMFLGMLLVLLLSIVLHYLFGRRHPSSSPPQKKRIRHEPDNA